MQYRSPFLVVFMTTLVLSPLTIRALDRAQIEIAGRNDMFLALQSRDTDRCDVSARLGVEAPDGCVRVSRASLQAFGSLGPLLVAARN